MLDREAPGHRRGDPRRRAARGRRTRCSRAASPGFAGATLIVNLPGSPGGCRDGFAVLQPALVHALELAAGDQGSRHAQT